MESSKEGELCNHHLKIFSLSMTFFSSITLCLGVFFGIHALGCLWVSFICGFVLPLILKSSWPLLLWIFLPLHSLLWVFQCRVCAPFAVEPWFLHVPFWFYLLGFALSLCTFNLGTFSWNSLPAPYFFLWLCLVSWWACGRHSSFLLLWFWFLEFSFWFFKFLSHPSPICSCMWSC